MPQFARPNVDVTVTAWLDDTGDAVDLWDHIDESAFSDADFVKSATPPAGGNEYETNMTTVTDPVSSTGHIMRWRRQAPVAGGSQINLTVRLMMGVTQITSQADTALPATFTTTTYTLSGAEADAITDYTDLRFEFVAAQV